VSSLGPRDPLTLLRPVCLCCRHLLEELVVQAPI
jgi:hypothetical protein